VDGWRWDQEWREKMKNEKDHQICAPSPLFWFLTMEEFTVTPAGGNAVVGAAHGSGHDVAWDQMDKRKFYFLGMSSFLGIRTLIYPAQLVKTRIVIARKGSVYKSTSHAFRTILKQEGFMGMARPYFLPAAQLKIPRHPASAL